MIFNDRQIWSNLIYEMNLKSMQIFSLQLLFLLSHSLKIQWFNLINQLIQLQDILWPFWTFNLLSFILSLSWISHYFWVRQQIPMPHLFKWDISTQKLPLDGHLWWREFIWFILCIHCHDWPMNDNNMR